MPDQPKPDELDVEELQLNPQQRRAMKAHDSVCEQLGALANDFEAKTLTFKALLTPEKIQDIVFAKVFYEQYSENKFHEEQVNAARQQFRNTHPEYVAKHKTYDMPPESELGPIPEYPLKGEVQILIKQMEPFMTASFTEMGTQSDMFAKQLRLIRDIFCRTRF